MVVALGWAYQHYGGLSWMQAVFYGVGACVIGIIASERRRADRARPSARDWLLWMVLAVSAVCTVIHRNGIHRAVSGGRGLWCGWCRTPPRFRRRPTAARRDCCRLHRWRGAQFRPAPTRTRCGRSLLFFTKAGAFVFGSGLAIVPFLYSGVVKEYGWLDDQAIPGRRGRGHDYAGAGRDHRGLHRLPGGRF